MKCHADFESGYPVVGSFQNWEEHQQSAALMLYCFGTQPSINAADPDIHFKALRRMQQKLEKQFDAIHESEGGRDPRFIVTKLNFPMDAVGFYPSYKRGIRQMGSPENCAGFDKVEHRQRRSPIQVMPAGQAEIYCIPAWCRSAL